ncbi:AAA family ATPase, partial [Candidatus Peregrinibacteria bacterium]|nr:AAA family ATPase [Candidatus Peregrinibacteria bacterium]
NLLAERDVLQKELMDVFARIFAHRDSHADSVDIAERDVLESEISTIEKRVAALKNEEPAVAAMLQYDELQQRLREQREGGFMQFPSRRKIVHDMMAGLLSDTPLAIMYGESGVGKTAIAKQLAPTLGVPITVHTGGGDRVTPFQNLLFSREIDAQRGTYIAYGPLLQAMTGYADSRMEQQIHRGAIFFDDEFNTRPSGMQREILKFVAKAKPGSTIDVTGRNLRVTVQPGFVYVAAGNPPGSRYQRDVTPQEAYREVATKCFVDYLDQSPDNPELFTTMVVGLLDEKTGRSRIVGAADIMPAFVRDPSLGREVLDPDPRSGGFLWRFANAWKQTLNARYPDREGELLLKKEDPTAAEGTYSIENIIVDLGTVRRWLLDDFQQNKAAQREGIASFLTRKLREELSMQIHATETEKECFRKHFARFGIDLAGKAVPTPPAAPTILTPVECGLLFPTVPRLIEEKLVAPKDQSAFLRDGSEVRYEAEPKSVDGNDRIVLAPGDTMIIDGGQEATYIGAVENKMQPFLIRVSGHYQLIHYSQIDDARTLLLRMRGPSTSVDSLVVREAKDIIEKGGGKFYGPESLIAMGLKAPDKLPPMPPKEEVERYAALGFDMRLEVSAAPDGKTITPEWMNSILQKVFDALPDTSPKAGRILYQNPQKPNDNWYKKSPETFYSDAKLTTCWAFTSGTKTRGCTACLLDGSKGKNYLEQTDEIVTFVEQLYPKGQPLPQDIDVAGAVKQFKTKRKAIEPNLSGSKWKDAADELARLDINQIFRSEAQEVLFYFAQTFLNSPPNQRERLLETLYAWTKTQSSGGRLVYAGECVPEGALVRGGGPDDARGALGVLLVRKFRSLKP